MNKQHEKEWKVCSVLKPGMTDRPLMVKSYHHMCEFVDMLMSKNADMRILLIHKGTCFFSAEANDNESFCQLRLLLVHDDGLPHAQHAKQKSSTLNAGRIWRNFF